MHAKTLQARRELQEKFLEFKLVPRFSEALANIVRDVFINRVIMMLRSSDALPRYLGLPLEATGLAFRVSVDPMPTSPMKAIEAVNGDPLFYLRVAAEERHEKGPYLIDLPPKLDGFACYLDETQVPGTEADRKSTRLNSSH